MKTASKRIVSVALLLVLIFSLSANSFAANVCSNIRGNTGKPVKFAVAAGPRLLLSDKITLTQSQGTMKTGLTFQNNKIYWAYDVKVEQLMGDGGKITKYMKWKYSKNFTITLEKGYLYHITVSPVSSTDVILHYGLRKLSDEIISLPDWWVSSTSGITSCARLS